MDVTVSAADVAEWRAVREVRLRALAADPGAFGSTLARELAFDDGVWRERVAAGRTFLARRDGVVVGIASFYAEPGRQDERELVGMWVTPEARRTGVAPALVEAVRRAAAAEGAARLTLFIAEGNEPARRLYERLGFRSTGEVQELQSDPCRGQERYALALS
ncbi:GNAT family N-acetyltransferase [Georgenia thermotolerans]|uniref:GNAT family N-acetyltransferase n=1 Tax=Georgenia thermotolerans TaxID=527326 RepID=A0A7J5UNJ9_9MICO|nr:GNAT family N-acetyltransferase [Georgenia thermotolerans]KAE8763674.1 GNAT family N-acetyltransferase [Georgenia thermotolerans]